MKLFKRSERIKNSGKDLIKLGKLMGGCKHLGRYSKWIEVSMGQLQARLDIYEMKLIDGGTGWFLVDALGQAACPVQTDRMEVLNFLNAEGWKVEAEHDDDDDEEVEE